MGDSAPADQSMKQQINADAGEQDDSSTQVSQPSVQPESSSSAGESAEASALPEQQQSSGGFLADAAGQRRGHHPPSAGTCWSRMRRWATGAPHNGIDISAATGTAVTAASDGIVTGVHSDPDVGQRRRGDQRRGRDDLCGPGRRHRPSRSTSRSPPVRRSARSGQIPCELSLEPHLHFDVQVNGDYVDPASLVE